MIPKSESNIATQKKSASVYLIATKALRFYVFQALLIKHQNIGRVLHFYYGQQFAHAKDTGVCGLGCQVTVWIDAGVCGL